MSQVRPGHHLRRGGAPRAVEVAAWLCAGLGMVGFGQITRGEEVFRFLEPRSITYRVDSVPAAGRSLATAPRWLPAQGPGGSTNLVWLGSQVVVQVRTPGELAALLADQPVRVSEVCDSNVFVLDAPDALTAARLAATWAEHPAVTVSHPVRRRPVKLHGGFAPRPNDPLFPKQWHLENRDTNSGARLGFDLNIRSAWAVTRGAGVVVAQGDDGLQLDHEDLQETTAGAAHYNFFRDTENGAHPGSIAGHGTAVGGLIAAADRNGRGVAGVAPAARLASWVVFDTTGRYLDEAQARRMFQYASNVVSVQNHSWGNADRPFLSVGVLESQGIANAISRGRQGRGVVMVRAAGNERLQLNNANDDAYANDPRVITVGAVRANGQVTSYSTPGACVLVAAFSADRDVEISPGVKTNFPSLATTDRIGILGYNLDWQSGWADYAFDRSGFEGTSGATPQISGICALMLSVNPALTWRDVQQVLILSARQLDPADPAVRTNGAGLQVSHHVGFGVPDAGRAVALAQQWRPRPPRVEVTTSYRGSEPIPDDGLRVEISGARVPPSLVSIPVWPADGLHVDDPTEAVPLVDVGRATEPIAADLTGKAALIERGQNYFVEKIRHAAAAGARFVIIWNNVGTTDRVFITGVEVHRSPIPVVFMDHQSGQALRDWLATAPDARARVVLQKARFVLPVSASLQCEHVTLRVRTTHQRRGDVRITLVSPTGTRSVLQHFNEDLSNPLDDWTYSSVHHFFEPSAGDWAVEVSDERAGVVGTVTALDLTVTGVSIEDVDADGLDDAWEEHYWAGLEYGPAEDPDRDGASNLVESLLGTDPRVAPPLVMELGAWDTRFWRLAWSATPYNRYQLEAAREAAGPFEPLVELTADFGLAEWLVPADGSPDRFFRVRCLEGR